MLILVEAEKRIQWDTFTVQDEFAIKFKVNVGVVTTSNKMMNVLLERQKYRGVRYLDSDNNYKIGYGFGDPDFAQGFTEADSFSAWYGEIKNKEKTLKAQLPIINMPLAAFDGLMGLYTDLNKWRTVDAEEGTYDLFTAVKNGNWLLVADILSRASNNSDYRRKEARIIQLADYSYTKNRQQIKLEGIRNMRSDYVNGYSNSFDTTQAEFAYYRELGAFLPGMSNLRQRRVVAQAIT